MDVNTREIGSMIKCKDLVHSPGQPVKNMKETTTKTKNTERGNFRARMDLTMREIGN